MTQDQLAEAVPLLAREPVVEALHAARYIVETEDERLCLARDLHQVSVAELARDLGLAMGLQHGVAERRALEQVADATGLLPGLLNRLREAEDEILGAPVAEVIAGHAAEADQSPAAVNLQKAM